MTISVRSTNRSIAGDDVVDYAFMGTDPNSADNRWLLDAMREQTPVIYLLGHPVQQLARAGNDTGVTHSCPL
jgi:hypothetical protein